MIYSAGEGRAHATFWRFAALGLAVMALSNAALLGSAWMSFAASNPDYLAGTWPTFSRALTHGNFDLYKWLGGIAGVGLLLGAASVALMLWEKGRSQPKWRALMRARALCAAFASLLGVVHYFHVTTRLGVNTDLHMALSHVFFFGMSGAILGDFFCSLRIARSRAVRLHHMVGFGVLGSGAIFLLTYVLKDAEGNPWPVHTQRLFVVAEWCWIVLAHAYAVLYVRPVRAHFAAKDHEVPVAGRAVAGIPVLLSLACLAWYATGAGAAASGSGIGGTGRIQPADGVLAVSAPPGRVERIEVREGDRVRKGAVLLVLAEQSVRALERDLAAERVKRAELQSVERTKAAQLEIDAARLTLAQAQAEVSAVAGLDPRTFPERERRSRANAVAQAEIALGRANARLNEARKSTDADLKVARASLKLAEAALLATRLTAPIDATVLEIHVQPGSVSGHGAAVTLANTSRMYVVADFFEGDLAKLAPGQRVRASNTALGQPLEGAIERIGRLVDPVNRLAKVWVRLDRPSPADNFIGMQVDVKVDTERVAATRAAPP